MTANTAWRPAPRPGIVPLHPLPFGTILGRSFTALRQNPRVLLGFALVVQTVAYVIVIIAVGAIGVASFSRLDTLQYGSDDYTAIMAGSIASTAIAGVILGLAVGALTVMVQGIVVIEVTHAVVAEKLPLKALWRQLRPAVWRLLGYALLLSLSILILIALVVVAIVALAIALPPLAIVLGILLFLGAIPLYLWLSVKLLIVPSIIIIEGAPLAAAVVRSWRLVRGRFWSTLGVFVIIQAAFATLAQGIALPFSFITSGIVSIVAPTGIDDTGAIVAGIAVAVLTQILTLLVQSVAVVVLSTATALVYVDCRMRHEGLDLDLAEYVEQRDAGATALPDPYRVHVGREIAPRPPAGAYAPPAGYPPYGAPPYPGAAYPAQGYPQHGYPQYPQGFYPPQAHGAPPAYPAQAYGAPPYPAQPHGAPPPAPPSAVPAPDAAPPASPAATQWTAPGRASDGDS